MLLHHQHLLLASLQVVWQVVWLLALPFTMAGRGVLVIAPALPPAMTAVSLLAAECVHHTADAAGLATVVANAVATGEAATAA
jgi:hypothetical protein